MTRKLLVVVSVVGCAVLTAVILGLSGSAPKRGQVCGAGCREYFVGVGEERCEALGGHWQRGPLEQFARCYTQSLPVKE